MLFAELRLAEPILRALVTEGYVTATPVQAAAIPHALAGKDVLGCAQTGTGKTAAFALPILHRLASAPKTDVKQNKGPLLGFVPPRENWPRKLPRVFARMVSILVCVVPSSLVV